MLGVGWGVYPLRLVLPSPRGCTEFLGKSRTRGSWLVLGTVRRPTHISHAATSQDGVQGRCFWNLS